MFLGYFPGIIKKQNAKKYRKIKENQDVDKIVEKKLKKSVDFIIAI